MHLSNFTQARQELSLAWQKRNIWIRPKFFGFGVQSNSIKPFHIATFSLILPMVVYIRNQIL